MKLRLLPRAESDLLGILVYGREHFGNMQAERYRTGLRASFETIRTHPLMYQAVPDIGRGYRRAVYRSHSIYYRIEGQVVVIARILGKQDVRRAFR